MSEQDASATSTERLKLWLGFWRTVVVGGAVAAIGIVAPPWIAKEIKEKELEIARSAASADIQARRLELEQEYVSLFIDGGTDLNVENRFRFTRYLSALTKDTELKEGWLLLFEDARREREETKQRLRDLEGESNETANYEIEWLRRELDVYRQTNDLVRVWTIPLDVLANNAPCPSNSTMVVGASESPFNYDDAWQTAVMMSSFVRKLANVPSFVKFRRFDITRWCVDEFGENVVDGLALSPDGAILRQVSSKPEWWKDAE